MSRFSLGAIEITPGASAALMAADADPGTFLARHQRGDWGEVGEHRQQGNEFALRHGHAIRSAYRLAEDAELWVITAADRSCTRLLLATEYERREVSTQEGYALWAASYDQEKNPLIAIEEPPVEGLVAALPVSTVLDVGTGTGRYALKFARRGATVTAVDRSPEMLAVAQRAARAEGLAIELCLASLGELPFAPGQFDLLVCALTLCHVPDLSQALCEFSRVVRGSGYLLITDFHPNGVAEGWRTLFSRPGTTYLLPNTPHTRSDYLHAVESAGCALLNVLDVPLGDVPEGYLSEAMIREHGDKPLCLILLAQK
jgi:SAM-dependent methyltransferase